MKNLKIGQRVAKGSDINGFICGEIKDENYEGLLLVKFDLGYSRWCNPSNLQIVTKK